MRKIVKVENHRLPDGLWAKYMMDEKYKYFTKSYIIWACMKARCSDAYQKKRPIYQGCHMHKDFLDYQKFVDWHMSQIGFNEECYVIDKDILYPGNRIYGPDTCVLVPKGFNSFCSKKPEKCLPAGVVTSMTPGRYRAMMKSEGKQIRLGTFSSVEEASEAYTKAKREEELRWIERLTTPYLRVDERVILILQRGRSY